MFLCDDCHDAKAHIELFRSRGKCEGCGIIANCIDCHYLHCEKPKEKPKVH